MEIRRFLVGLKVCEVTGVFVITKDDGGLVSMTRNLRLRWKDGRETTHFFDDEEYLGTAADELMMPTSDRDMHSFHPTGEIDNEGLDVFAEEQSDQGE